MQLHGSNAHSSTINHAIHDQGLVCVATIEPANIDTLLGHILIFTQPIIIVYSNLLHCLCKRTRLSVYISTSTNIKANISIYSTLDMSELRTLKYKFIMNPKQYKIVDRYIAAIRRRNNIFSS